MALYFKTTYKVSDTNPFDERLYEIIEHRDLV